MNSKLTVALLAGITCIYCSRLSAQSAQTTTSAPQPLSGTNAVNGTASGMMNAPTAGSTTQTINQPGVTTRSDLTTGRVGAPTGSNAQAISTPTAQQPTTQQSALPNNNARAMTAPAGAPIGSVNSTTTQGAATGTQPFQNSSGNTSTGITAPGTRPQIYGTGVMVGTPQNASEQGTNAYDAAVTRQIRERITRSDLSMNARNVKIITRNGEVVLRGPVDSSTEQTTIQNIARDIVGSGRVSNETTIR